MATSDSPFRPYHLWIVRLMLLAAVGFTLYGCLQLWEARRLVRHGVHGQATVADYKVLPAEGRNPTLYQPVLRFTDLTGKIWQKDDDQSSSERLYSVGQNVEVIYPPAQPGNFKTNTWNSVWALGIVLVSVGPFAILLFYGLLVYVHVALDRPEFGARWTWLDPYLLPLKIVFRLLGA